MQRVTRKMKLMVRKELNRFQDMEFIGIRSVQRGELHELRQV
jgi:hypothetical protein